MKLDPGERGLSKGRDLASYDLRSNSLRTFSSAESRAPPLELHPNTSMRLVGRCQPCPMRAGPRIKYQCSALMLLASPRSRSLTALGQGLQIQTRRASPFFWANLFQTR